MFPFTPVIIMPDFDIAIIFYDAAKTLHVTLHI